ncbi:MAG: hypothetical protein JO286_00680 [Solirubrobacterales bacterium]|nr:hypothetical protein [Solirubrobacterales bacterium]MBV9805658.1 hypothetical protein [Solirubrobacterales bacterium]
MSDVATSYEAPAIKALSGSVVEIKIPAPVQPKGVGVNYVTSQDNKPQTYANNIYVWKTTSNNVPWGTTPDGNTAVAADTPVSTQFLSFPFLVQQDYIVGYAVAADPNAVCSTVYIPGATQSDPSTYVTSDTTISINSWGNNYVQVKLTGLGNYSPSANKNWVGVWELDHVPYSGDPIAKTNVALTSAHGLIYIGNVPLTIGSTYSVGYFMAASPAGRTALACSVTFNT